MEQSPSPGTLYLIATPIGNLADISSRALHLLASVDYIACEDTRHSGKLLQHYGIRKELISYYRENEHQRCNFLLEKLLHGFSVAIISDAGTPGISDPGSLLVRQARAHGIPVSPIPGASALTSALSVSGLKDTAFYFGGFPPAKRGQRLNYFATLLTLPCALVFYESPHRIKASLEDCLKILGNRHTLLFRELTKLHEECVEGTLSHLITHLPDKVKGEIVFILQPGEKEMPDTKTLDDILISYRNNGTSLKDAVQQITRELAVSRSIVYPKALQCWRLNNASDSNDKSTD